MVWKLDKKRPVCPQICEHICVAIASGALSAGERLPSIRDIAVEAGVNPNTVQHSFATLESEGILYSVRGSGWFVSEDTKGAQIMREKLLQEKTAEFFETLGALGMDSESIKQYVKEWNQ